MLLRRLRLALPLAATILMADCTTKELAVERLSPEQIPHAVAGDLIQFTLTYNDGAAMNLPVGENPRWRLVGLSLVMILVLLRLLWRTPETATGRRAALGLILGGAIGNLVSRVSGTRGVVDFIDVGFGSARFWIFNVADIAVTCGALLLAWVIWNEDRRARA